MKTWILAAVVATSALAASEARADDKCALGVSSPEVSRGALYSYGLYITPPPPPPAGPGWPAPPPTFNVVFWGTRNGVPDIVAPGEYIGAPLLGGSYYLTGYQNPSSGVASGVYTRYAVITYNNNNSTYYCTTNEVTITLD